jgi:hypothetical protein
MSASVGGRGTEGPNGAAFDLASIDVSTIGGLRDVIALLGSSQNLPEEAR